MWFQVGAWIIKVFLCKLYDCLTTMLYTWSQHKIILNVNCNWKIKLRKKSRLKFYNLFSNSYINAVNFLLLMMVRESCHHTPWMITRNCSFWNWWSLQYLLSHIFCFFSPEAFFQSVPASSTSYSYLEHFLASSHEFLSDLYFMIKGFLVSTARSFRAEILLYTPSMPPTLTLQGPACDSYLVMVSWGG